MKLDEFNNVKVTNESSTFKKEFGGTPSDEFRFFNDNVTNIKSEINVDKTSNDDLRPVENEEKAETRPQEEKLKNEDLKRNTENSGDRSSQSSSSSSSSSTSTGTVSQASSTATSVASTSASVATAASVVAVATVSAVAGVNVLTNQTAKADLTSFLMFNNRVEYQLNLSGIEEDENFVILVEGTNYSKTNPLKAGFNSGSFEGLTPNKDYTIKVYEDKLMGNTFLERTFTYLPQFDFKGLIFDKNYDSRDNSFNVQLDYIDEINALSRFTFELQKLSEGQVASSQTFELEKKLESQKLVAVDMDLSGDFKYVLSYREFEESKSIESEVFNFVDIAPQVITGLIKSISFSDKLGEDNASFTVSLEFEGETSVISDISLILSTQESSTVVALENKIEQTIEVSSQDFALEPDTEYSYSLSYKVNGNDAEPLLGKVSFEPEEVIPTAEVTSFEAVANAEFAKSTFSISVSFDGEVELESLDIYPQEDPNDIRELSVVTQKGEQTIDYSKADLMLEQDTTYCLVLHYLADGEEKEISTVAKFVDISKYATFNGLIFDKTANFKDGSFSVQLDYEESETGLFSDFQLTLTDVVNNISHTYDLEATKDVQTLQLFTRAAGASFDPSSTFTYQLSYKNQGELVEEATSEQFTFADSYVSSSRITEISLVNQFIDFSTGEALIRLTYEDETDDISNIMLYVVEPSSQKEDVFNLEKTPEDQFIAFGELSDGNLSYTLSYDVYGKPSEEPLKGTFQLSQTPRVAGVSFDGVVNFKTRETSLAINYIGDLELFKTANFVLQDAQTQVTYEINIENISLDVQTITLPEQLDLSATYNYYVTYTVSTSEGTLTSDSESILLSDSYVSSSVITGISLVNDVVDFSTGEALIRLTYEDEAEDISNIVLHINGAGFQEEKTFDLDRTTEPQQITLGELTDGNLTYSLTYDVYGKATEEPLEGEFAFTMKPSISQVSFDGGVNFKNRETTVTISFVGDTSLLDGDRASFILKDNQDNIYSIPVALTQDTQTITLPEELDLNARYFYYASVYFVDSEEFIDSDVSEIQFTDTYVSSSVITGISLVNNVVDFSTGEASIQLTYEDEAEDISNIVLHINGAGFQEEKTFDLDRTTEPQQITFGELSDGNLSYTLSYDVYGKPSEEPIEGEFVLTAKPAISQVIFDGNVNFETRETSVTLNFTGDTSLLDEERVNFILQDMDNQDNIYSIPVALTQDTQTITLPEELDLDARYFYCASAYYKDSEEFIDSEVNEITLTNTQTGTFEGFEVNNEVNFDERIISVLLNYEEVKPGTFTNFVLHLLNEDEQEVTSITLAETNEAQSQSVDDQDFVFDEETPYYCKLTYDENGVAQEFMLPDMITFVNTNVDQDPRITNVSFTGELDFTTGEAFISLDSNAAFETFTNVEFVLTDINNNVDHKFTLTDLKSTINLNDTDNQIDYQSIFKYHVSYIVDEEQFSTEEQGPIELTNSHQEANSFNGADFITDVNFSTYEIKVKLDYTLDSASSISNIVLTLKDNSSDAELVKDLQPINGEYQTVSFADTAFELNENTSYQYSFTYYINDELQPTFTGDNSLVFTNTVTPGDENIINTVAFDGNVNFKTRDAYVTIDYVGDLESFSNVYFVLQDIQDETKTYNIPVPNISLDTQTINLPEYIDLTAMYNYYVTYNVTDKQETLTSSVYQVEIKNTYESESNVTSVDFAEQEIDFSAGEISVTLNYLDNTDDLSDFVLTLHETATGDSRDYELNKTNVSQKIIYEGITDGDFTYELTWKVVGETCKNPISGSVHFNEHQQTDQTLNFEMVINDENYNLTNNNYNLRYSLNSLTSYECTNIRIVISTHDGSEYVYTHQEPEATTGYSTIDITSYTDESKNPIGTTGEALLGEFAGGVQITIRYEIDGIEHSETAYLEARFE